MSIREQIKVIQQEIGQGDIPPTRAVEMLNQLSALLGNINDQIILCDNSYAKRLLLEYEESEKANRAKIKAEISDEYRDKMVARATKELTVELIRSLKYFIRSLETVYREGGQQ